VPESDSTILVIGAASMDLKGRAGEPLIQRTSNPGDIHTSCGGEARNVAENLARLGLDVRLLSAVGDDAAGMLLLEQSRQAGVDCSRVVVSPEHRSAAYLAVLDESGNLAISIDDMKVLGLLKPGYIHRNRGWFKDAAMVAVDTNLSTESLDSTLKAAERYGVPVAANAVSVLLAHRIAPVLSRLHLVTANLAEAGRIVGRELSDHRDAMFAAREMVSQGVEIAIVTLAENGICYATHEEQGNIEAIQCDIVDKTGAGAALMAAVVYGLVSGMPADESMRLGVSAATLTLKSSDTVSRDLDLDSLYDQLVI
jgi:pseudouridine kinase